MSEKKFNPAVSDKARQLIGSFVRERRKELKISSYDLAEQADIRQHTLLDLELGKPCTLNTLLAVLECLGGRLLIEFEENQ